MIGLDTTVLLEFEIAEAPRHRQTRLGLHRLLDEPGTRYALAPQVLQEFLHIATDPRRFDEPLSMTLALDRTAFWWNASEVTRLFSGEASTALALRWIKDFRLGRKRILDTWLAAIYHTSGVTSLATSNPDDFRVFGCFDFVDLAAT